MIIYSILFYVFAILMVLSAFAVVSVKNSVYAVLLLIFTFFNAAALFVLLGAEFLAMSLVIVYVGAVAVLFLFVVMMLDIRVTAKKYVANHKKFFFFLGTVFLAELIAVIYISVKTKIQMPNAKTPIIYDGIKDNTYQIGLTLYTDYGYLFQICGLILFVAIISAITLTHRGTRNTRKQNHNNQVKRQKHDTVKLISVKIGEGVDARRIH